MTQERKIYKVTIERDGVKSIYPLACPNTFNRKTYEYYLDAEGVNFLLNDIAANKEEGTKVTVTPYTKGEEKTCQSGLL